MTTSEGATVLQDSQMMSSISWFVSSNVPIRLYHNGYYCAPFPILRGPLAPDPKSLPNSRLTDTTAQDRVTILLGRTPKLEWHDGCSSPSVRQQAERNELKEH